MSSMINRGDSSIFFYFQKSAEAALLLTTHLLNL